jgi:hypothetical protein
MKIECGVAICVLWVQEDENIFCIAVCPSEWIGRFTVLMKYAASSR